MSTIQFTNKKHEEFFKKLTDLFEEYEVQLCSPHKEDLLEEAEEDYYGDCPEFTPYFYFNIGNLVDGLTSYRAIFLDGDEYYIHNDMEIF